MSNLHSQLAPSRSSGPAIPLYVSPSVQGALEQLGILLDDYHYSPHARGRILAYTAANGTPTGCPELDREDEADAGMVFEESLEPVDFGSVAWDRSQDVLFDMEMLIEGNHPFPVPAYGDDDEDGLAVDSLEPRYTAEDEADYARWLRDRERREPGPLPFPCQPHPLYDFLCEDEPPMFGYE
jgi:hypothetical protein